MSSHQKDIEDRWLVYKNYNHIPSVKVSKYSFDEIEKIFSRIELNYNYNCKIRISYDTYFPEISNCVILNCANPDAPNADTELIIKLLKKVNYFTIQIFFRQILVTFIHLDSISNYYM